MSYEIRVEPGFLRDMKRLAKRYKSLKQDLEVLQERLLANPLEGVDLGGGVRKVCMAIGSKNRGKSHGARVITYTCLLREDEGTITLLALYDKQERDSISPAEVAQLVAEAKARAAAG